MGQRRDDLHPSLAQLHLHRLRTAPRIGPEWGWACGGTHQRRGRALSLGDERLDRGAAGADRGDTMRQPRALRRGPTRRGAAQRAIQLSPVTPSGQDDQLVRLGDTLRISVVLLRDWLADPNSWSEVVILNSVHTEPDGCKVLTVHKPEDQGR